MGKKRKFSLRVNAISLTTVAPEETKQCHNQTKPKYFRRMVLKLQGILMYFLNEFDK